MSQSVNVIMHFVVGPMDLLPDTQNCMLRMRRDYRERFPRRHVLALATCITARA